QQLLRWSPKERSLASKYCGIRKYLLEHRLRAEGQDSGAVCGGDGNRHFVTFCVRSGSGITVLMSCPFRRVMTGWLLGVVEQWVNRDCGSLARFLQKYPRRRRPQNFVLVPSKSGVIHENCTEGLHAHRIDDRGG